MSQPGAPSRMRLRSALLSAVLLAPCAAFADETLNVLVMRARDLEAQGRCDDALAVQQSAPAPDAQLGLIVGRCQVRTQDYAGAVETLRAARELPGATPEIDLQLGIAEYHLGELETAKASLDRSREAGQEGALLELYTGLLQLQAQDTRNAALSLERARREDRRVVEPVASYYSFIAWRQLEDEERAQAALDRLREEDPDGPWIAEAERILEGERPAEAPLVWWANAEAGLEFDSNVTIRGQNVAQVFINGDTVSDRQDGRGIWSFDGGAELWREGDWSAGLLGSYTGTAHFQINEFDAHYPAFATWLDHRLTERTTLRARYDFGYLWINYESYSLSNLLSGALFHDWERWGFTEITVQGGWYDFRYDRIPPFTDGSGTSRINQDGWLVSVEGYHYYEPGFRDMELRAGYRYTHYVANGTEFDYDAHRFLVGFDITLPFAVIWDNYFAFTYQPYERASVYADPTPGHVPKHRDQIYEFGTELEKIVWRNVSVLARYRYTDVDSNVDVYDYERHVVGGYVRIRFN